MVQHRSAPRAWRARRFCISDDCAQANRGNIDVDFHDVGEQPLKNGLTDARMAVCGLCREASSHPFKFASG